MEIKNAPEDTVLYDSLTRHNLPFSPEEIDEERTKCQQELEDQDQDQDQENISVTGLTYHPYFCQDRAPDSMKWRFVDVELKDVKGNLVFAQAGVEVPAFWSDRAAYIVAQKYFYGKQGTPEREYSLKQLVGRVVGRIRDWAVEQQYFASDGDLQAYCDDLTYLLYTQRGSFNSPVWFNLGIDAREQQVSACFINSVDDSMESIAKLQTIESKIFKRGSGSGVNLSNLRSSKEHLSGGGIASGPVSFMRGFDSWAGTIKSGGATRRAAAMRILNVDHPDIIDFIECKVLEERKAHALIAQGYPADFNDPQGAYASVGFQNANHSVRVTDAFMEAVEEALAFPDRSVLWELKGVHGELIDTISVRELWDKLCYAVWMCGDPGIQFDDTTNRWHTCPVSGKINASNPCSEFVFLDNSACNLASLNLMRFRMPNNALDIPALQKAVHAFIIAQDILVDNASYPTPEIADNSRIFRPLGLGYCNLGAYLMSIGMAYDSYEGRYLAAEITSVISAQAYKTSAELAEVKGPFGCFEMNRLEMLQVIEQHQDAASDMHLESAELWHATRELGRQHGFRNAQVTLLAPTGCLTPDTLVLSSAGLLPLEDLGDLEGEQWQDLEDIQILQEKQEEKATQFYCNGLADTYEIQTVKGHFLRGTGNHKIRILDTDANYIWRRLDEIKEGDWIAIRLGGHEQLLKNKPYIELAPPIKNTPHYRLKTLNLPVYLTEEIAEILGMYMGNGDLKQKEALRFNIDAEDKHLIEYIEEWAYTIGIEKCYKEERPGCVSIYLYSRVLTSWFRVNEWAKPKGNYGEGAAGAFVPWQVLQSRTSVLCAFIRGLFSTDGTCHQQISSATNVELSVTSFDLAYTVFTALEALGIQSNYHVTCKKENHNSFGTRPMHRVRPTHYNAIKLFLQKIGFHSASVKQQKFTTVMAQWGEKSPLVHDSITHPVLLAEFYAWAKENKLGSDLNQKICSRVYQGTASFEWVKQIVETHPVLKDTRLYQLYQDDRLRFVQCKSVSYHKDPVVTCDISVPKNNTYVAQSFVSHNTIGMIMDTDTTGVEPEMSLYRVKKLVGGGELQMESTVIEQGLKALGYQGESRQDILRHLKEHRCLDDCKALLKQHLPVFDCAIPVTGNRALSLDAHLEMTAAVQPFLSGAISKTMNLSEEATEQHVSNAFLKAWKLGIKNIALYRNNCKKSQPMQTRNADGTLTVPQETQLVRAVRRRLKDHQTNCHRIKFKFGEVKGYLLVTPYEDTGMPGEIFVEWSKEGSTVSGLVDGWAQAISYGLQYGVPLEKFVDKFSHTKFEPAGFSSDPDIKFAHSIYDALMRKLAAVFSEAPLPTIIDVPQIESVPPVETLELGTGNGVSDKIDGPPCMVCGTIMERNGANCHKCPVCGAAPGCG